MSTKHKINDQLIEELILQVNPDEVLSKDGLFTKLKKRIIGKMLEGEISHELGYKRHSREEKEDGNRRNGNWPKGRELTKTAKQMSKQAFILAF